MFFHATTVAAVSTSNSPIPVMTKMTKALGFHVPVTVTRPAQVGIYAISAYYTEHMGGYIIARERLGHWEIIGVGGGVADVPALVRHGVPASTAVELLHRFRHPTQKA